MQANRSRHHPVDGRIIVYRMAKNAAAIVVVFFLVKILFVDVVALNGDQMAPTMIKGDLLAVYRVPGLPLIRNACGRLRGHAVVITLPSVDAKIACRSCLRVVGISGDTVAVDSGNFKNSRDASLQFPRWSPADSETLRRREIMPAIFSPRDFIEPYSIPGPGDTLVLDSIADYRFFSALTVILQENPSSNFSFKANLSINDTLARDYFILDFMLYKGPLDSIPEYFRYDWFFWKRLKEYLRQTIGSDQKLSLSFEFYKDGQRVQRYVVHSRFLYLLADNWNRGYDSRYFGPVSVHRVFGMPLLVLWSSQNGRGINISRLGRIIR